MCVKVALMILFLIIFHLLILGLMDIFFVKNTKAGPVRELVQQCKIASTGFEDLLMNTTGMFGLKKLKLGMRMEMMTPMSTVWFRGVIFRFRFLGGIGI